MINENFCHKFSGLCIRNIPGTHSKRCRMLNHIFLKFQCQISIDKRGPGYWKLNVSYLQTDKYVNGIQNITNNLAESLTPIDKWERIKLKDPILS